DLIANESYSPYAASIALRNEEILGLTLSFKTIYNYIERGFFASLTKEDLPRKGKSSRRQYKGVRRTKRDPLAKSIRDRPEDANNRSELGHWEMDCMESGKKHRSTLLTMVDRRSRRTILLKLSSQTQSAVIKALDDLENSLGPEKFKMTFKTITVDNGSEFLNWKDMEASFFDKDEKRCRIYFCDAYSAYQRGTNEQINGQIRRHIPKGSIIRDYSKAQIKSIEEWINNYPRGIHAGHSALDVWLAEAA
ncbi:IS30 family transposase, partial [Dolosicoccus paucivorans]